MKFDIRPCSLEAVRELCERFHGYGGAGSRATYAFGVYESERALSPPTRGNRRRRVLQRASSRPPPLRCWRCLAWWRSRKKTAF